MKLKLLFSIIWLLVVKKNLIQRVKLNIPLKLLIEVDTLLTEVSYLKLIYVEDLLMKLWKSISKQEKTCSLPKKYNLIIKLLLNVLIVVKKQLKIFMVIKYQK
jgi:hypothetical protein